MVGFTDEDGGLVEDGGLALFEVVDGALGGVVVTRPRTVSGNGLRAFLTVTTRVTVLPAPTHAATGLLDDVGAVSGVSATTDGTGTHGNDVGTARTGCRNATANTTTRTGTPTANVHATTTRSLRS